MNDGQPVAAAALRHPLRERLCFGLVLASLGVLGALLFAVQALPAPSAPVSAAFEIGAAIAAACLVVGLVALITFSRPRLSSTAVSLTGILMGILGPFVVLGCYEAVASSWVSWGWVFFGYPVVAIGASGLLSLRPRWRSFVRPFAITTACVYVVILVVGP